eukprot:scaffold44051_cov60-Phaeocystis_antarctica.AAC.2
MGAVDQSGHEIHEGDGNCDPQHRRAYNSRSRTQEVRVRDGNLHHYGGPAIGANPLPEHRVMHSVDQHAACQAEHGGRGHTPHSPQKLRPERDPGNDGRSQSHQENVARKRKAEELRCKGRLVGGVCEGARDRVHFDGDRRCRLEVRIVLAPRGIACEERH